MRKGGRDRTSLLKYLGASPSLKIIDFFLDNPLSGYSKNEVVKQLVRLDMTLSRKAMEKAFEEDRKLMTVKP